MAPTRDGLVASYQDLAKSILLLARDDVGRASASLKDGARLKQALDTIGDVAVFVTSEWADAMCGLVGADGEAYRDIMESALNEAWELARDEIGGTPLEVSDKAIDCILYNRRAWREAVETIEGRTAGSIVLLPVARAPGDPVGRVATARATVTSILDAVDRALRGLPKEHQRIADFKWGQSLTHNEIADQVCYVVRTVHRRVNAIRASVRAYLIATGEEAMCDFWLTINQMLSDN